MPIGIGDGNEIDHELDDLADDQTDPVKGQPPSKPLRNYRRRPSTLWKGLTPHQRRVMERTAQLSMVWLDFKLRLCHALLILLSIFYLRLTTLLFKGLLCDRMPNPTAPTDSEAVMTESLYLREDGQTSCWSGAHISTATGVIILLTLYSAGFPIFCFVLLTRAFTDQSNSSGVIGWFRGNGQRPAFATLRAAIQHAGEAVRPASPSRGAWLQQPSRIPELVKKPSAVPLASADELLHAAKLQRRREYVHNDL